ncbi:MAG TPA: transcription elongation factor GreA [Chthonomonadaceae bacterium]|nr:transcription elongation factor GreA [Chthonomonadaceae bacterium]
MEQDELRITISTRKKKEEELHHLRAVKRPEITEAIRRAREYGDLSENFEYHAARQAMAILNGQIADLEAILERATVVEDDAISKDVVGLGTTVMLLDKDTDDEWECTIVDDASSDPINDQISFSSPVGKALIGKRVGEVIEVAVPDGKAHYEIVGLRSE